jgi:hypothetical protein
MLVEWGVQPCPVPTKEQQDVLACLDAGQPSLVLPVGQAILTHHQQPDPEQYLMLRDYQTDQVCLEGHPRDWVLGIRAYSQVPPAGQQWLIQQIQLRHQRVPDWKHYRKATGTDQWLQQLPAKSRPADHCHRFSLPELELELELVGYRHP